MAAVESGPVAPAPNARHHELVQERLRNVHLINLLRVAGVSAFFALFLFLGAALHLPAWRGNHELFAVYWLISVAVFSVARRFESSAPWTGLAIAVVDIPMVFFLQLFTFATSPSASGIAGFTVGVYVLLVILAALSLERWYIVFSGAVGAVFEVFLQHLAGVSVGAMVSTVILLGLTVVACWYSRGRLVDLVGRIEAAAHREASQRGIEDRLRETSVLLDIVRTLGGVTDVGEALRRICRELTRLTGADTVASYLVDPGHAELRPAAAYHVPRHLLRGLSASPIPLAHLGLARTLASGRSQWINAGEQSPEVVSPLFEKFLHHSGLVVPLMVDREVAGAFYLVWWTRRGHLDEPVRALVEAIGQQVGLFILHARLYEELNKNQERSIQTERLRALGEMAAGMAHDFNNLLAIIVGRADLLLETTESPQIRQALKIISTAARDGVQTVRRIQDFTRRTPTRPLEPVDPAALVHDVVEMTRARWQDQAHARGVRYEVITEGGPVPPVIGDGSDLREALMNLVFNALDAMPGGGRLTIRIAEEPGRVRLDVADTGIGMLPDVRQRVFEPFFSTKREKGSGLGLSVVYGIVTRLGGHITVESTPGAGSVFIVRLPVAAGRSGPVEGTPAGPRAARVARILVVDDEPEVLEMLCSILRLDGHSVVACHDGAAAVRALAEERFDLVLTDLGMPGLSGWDVTRAAKQGAPEMPVGLVTGWRDSLDPSDATRRGVDFVIAKPFQIRDLREALQLHLGATEGSKPSERAR